MHTSRQWIESGAVLLCGLAQKVKVSVRIVLTSTPHRVYNNTTRDVPARLLLARL